MYLFFDTETNGLPIRQTASPMEVNNWPRVAQLAWQLYSTDGHLQDEFCNLIKPDGWTIPDEKFFRDHGHSTERCEMLGVPIASALERFIQAVERSEFVIAHNLSFDLPIMQAEMIRAGMRASRSPKRFCTMKGTTSLLQLPGPRGLKWPNLQELHRFLFSTGFDGGHDALMDVRMTAKCFFELVSLELISIAP